MSEAQRSLKGSPPQVSLEADGLGGSFLPAVSTWFADRLGEPTPPQRRAWPAIARGEHVLVAAPTGSGKTLAALLSALNELLAMGDALPDETRVLYVSPLRALSNDIQKNLQQPLAEMRERDASLPDVRVLVRTGDTPPGERQKMSRRPPHVLVTTPESLYVLLTSDGGRRLLGTVRSVIVDEIHAVVGDKRGAHLALSLARLEELFKATNAQALQRIGLSATQKPLGEISAFLTGKEQAATIIDEGHLRPIELTVEIPPSPLETVCSHETWGEIHRRIAELVAQHRSTLIFANTRKVCERTARELTRIFEAEDSTLAVSGKAITSHHSSLSKDRRLNAEQRLKAGELRALVATASLELGIDIGDVDLVIQIGSTRRIATLLQRVGRSGHSLDRTPKGVIFPVSIDELAETAALTKAVRDGTLDRTPQPVAPLDVLAQQIVAECVHAPWDEDALFAMVRRAWPYRDLKRERFDATIALHTTEAAGGRLGLLHRDSTAGTLRATRRARLSALTSGGAIPDRADYRVVLEPDGLVVGSVDEDFAVESSSGDVFQLGNMSWRLLRMQPGTLFVADAQGAPPTLPFWFGEAPARTLELSATLGEVRTSGTDPAWLISACGLSAEVAGVLARYLNDAREALGATPTQGRIVLERFFDDSGGSQLVVHSLFGGRINRAFGLALRKRFCRHFGFELQAAANEDAVLISLGPMHSFPLEEVLTYVSSQSARKVLTQALLDSPMFQTRWRWNVSRALLAPRAPGGKRLPPPIQRMRADDLLAAAFPDAVACGENLPPGDLEIPEGHPMVDQTIEDCLSEAMDIEGLETLLAGLEQGTIESHCVDTAAPSPFARGALAIGPYGFLDDAGLEERRVQAVRTGRAKDSRNADALGVLDPDAVARVCEEAWPDPRDAEELHEALTWMGYVTEAEAARWNEGLAWLSELRAAGRVERKVHGEGHRWFASEASRELLDVLRGRLEAVGPVLAAEEEAGPYAALENEGVALRVTISREGREVQAWCHRRLLARIQRYTLEGRRSRIRPIPTGAFRRFLAGWQGVTEEQRRVGPAGLLRTIEQLAGWEAAAPLWESHLFPARVRDYKSEWLDDLGYSGQISWGRLWGSSTLPVRSAPMSFFPRAESGLWQSLAGPADVEACSWPARSVHAALLERGALFPADLTSLRGLLPSDAERGIDELVGAGLATSDAFAAVRPHLRAPSKRPTPGRPGSFGNALGAGLMGGGRWSLFRTEPAAPSNSEVASDALAEQVARHLLRRYGVLFRALLERERLPARWRDLARALRLMELRGDVHGGRFVDGYAGEQFADPAAVRALRDAGRAHAELDAAEWPEPLDLHRADPLALDSVLVPGGASGILGAGIKADAGLTQSERSTPAASEPRSG